MTHPSVSVILPTYNEAENIVPLIRKLLVYLPTKATILVVDDQSPDQTAEAVKLFSQTTAAQNRVNLLVRTKNHGLTNSLRDGIAASKSQVVVWLDCDFSHPPEIVPLLIDGVMKGADIALASRFLKTALISPTTQVHTGSPMQFALSQGLNSLISRSLGPGVTDYTTGFLAVRRRVLDHLPLRGDYGEYCIDLLVRAKLAGYRIVEIPYTSPPRLLGQSKTAPNLPALISHGYGYIATLLRLLAEVKLRRQSYET